MRATATATGTHCAGTASGRLYGVATAASVVGVKVFDDSGDGFSADTIAGIDWVIARKIANPTTPMVASLSLRAVPRRFRLGV